MRSWLEATLMSAWRQRGLLAWLLRPLSLLFQWLVARRRQRLTATGAQTRLPVPVVVVGNIFIGGTGKTPLTIWLIRQLQAAGWHPAVVSRAYGTQTDEARMVESDMAVADSGDEPLLIAQRTACPVAVGRDRVAAAQMVLKRFPHTDVLIADDGLQHYALARDVEIMLFDQRGIGNGWMLPAGPLRETAQRERDFTLFNLVPGQVPPPVPLMGSRVFQMHLQPGAIYALADASQQHALSSLAGNTVTAAAGIGHPERFFQMLRTAGLTIHPMPLSDHHAFNAQIFDMVQTDFILITEKDAVKCRQIATLRDDRRIWVVPVDAHIDTAFAEELLTLISEKRHGRSPA